MTPTRPEPVAEVLERARTGDRRAFLELYQRFDHAMRVVARRYVREASVADEVVQDSWEAIIKGIETFEGRSRLSTWMFAIVANKARSRIRKERRTLPFSALEDPDEEHGRRFEPNGSWLNPPAPWTRGADAILADRQMMHKLQGFLEQLPESQRAVVVLRDVQGEDAKTVCNLLELSDTNQRVLLHRGRVRLRALLESLESEP